MIKRNTIYGLLIGFSLISNNVEAQMNTNEESFKFDEGKLYIKYKNSTVITTKNQTSKQIKSAQLPKMQLMMQKYGIHIEAFSMSLFEDENLQNTVRIRFDSLQRTDALIEELQKNQNVEYVEKVPLYRLFSTASAEEDPYAKEIGGRNLKWHLDLIHAKEAHAIQAAKPNIKVAIVDGAIWGEHEDLQITPENQYHAPSKKVGNSAPPSAIEQDIECNIIKSCASYSWSHGTHCAGLVGAINNNGKGIASVGSGLTLMGVSVETVIGFMIADAFEGISWAAENGAKVISCSWGGGALSQTHSDILKACYKKGIILVFATGNSASSSINYPAASPYVISVGAVNSNKGPSSFSNHGYWVDVASPGGFEVNKDGMETKNTILSTTFCKNQSYRLDNYGELNGTYYDGMAGTSMATPIVAGLVGYLLSEDSTLNAPLMKALLTQSGQALNYANTNKLFNEEATLIDAKAALDYMKQGMLYPSDLKATFGNKNVSLRWNAPIQTQETPTHYKLYRNRQLIDEYVLGCSYIDLDIEKGEYEYAVQAVYKDGSLSLKNGVGVSVRGYYTLDVKVEPSAEAGSIENCGKMAQNEIIELIAHSKPGYHFVAWKLKGEVVSTNTIFPVLLSQDTAFVAVFKGGVSNEVMENNLSTFYINPNPANNQIRIFTNENSLDCISILNLTGIEVLRIHKPFSKSINIEKLPKGLYFLRASKENRKYVSKFIKQ